MWDSNDVLDVPQVQEGIELMKRIRHSQEIKKPEQ
jgi:hypothetical protein